MLEGLKSCKNCSAYTTNCKKSPKKHEMEAGEWYGNETDTTEHMEVLNLRNQKRGPRSYSDERKRKDHSVSTAKTLQKSRGGGTFWQARVVSSSCRE